MIARFGQVLYWLASIVAILIAGTIAFGYFFGSLKGDPFMQLAGLVIAAVIWLFGRACRYVLADR